MKEEKGLTNVLKALPDLLKMEQTWGLLATIVRQWGLGNVIPILLGTVRKTGLMKSITSLLSFRLDKIFPNLLASMWDTFGDREAFICGEKRVTYKEFKEKVFRIANGLCDLGLKKGDVVEGILHNTIEHVEIYFGAWFAGCTYTALSWHEKGEAFIAMIAPNASIISWIPADISR